MVCDFRVPLDGAVRVCCADDMIIASTVMRKLFSKV